MKNSTKTITAGDKKIITAEDLALEARALYKDPDWQKVYPMIFSK
jgi:hypothetical protein